MINCDSLKCTSACELGAQDVLITFSGHGPEISLSSMRSQARPCRDVNIFSLRYHEIFQQRLDVLPARERSNTPEGQLHNTGETFSGGISKNGTLHMGRLHLSAV